jgi:hypothetical protein
MEGKPRSTDSLGRPVVLGHYIYEDTPLQEFHPFNSPSEPIVAKKPNDRHKVWADLVRYIIVLVRDGQK